MTGPRTGMTVRDIRGLLENVPSQFQDLELVVFDVNTGTTVNLLVNWSQLNLDRGRVQLFGTSASIRVDTLANPERTQR